MAATKASLKRSGLQPKYVDQYAFKIKANALPSHRRCSAGSHQYGADARALRVAQGMPPVPR